LETKAAAQTGKRGSCQRDIVRNKVIIQSNTREIILPR